MDVLFCIFVHGLPRLDWWHHSAWGHPLFVRLELLRVRTWYRGVGCPQVRQATVATRTCSTLHHHMQITATGDIYA